MNSDPEPFVLRFSGACTIREAAACHARLSHALPAAAGAKAGGLVVACDDVTEADVSFLQLLIAAGRAAAAAGHALALRAPSPALRRLAWRAGLLASETAELPLDPAAWGRA